MPMMESSIATTAAKTGRRTERSDSCISCPVALGLRPAGAESRTFWPSLIFTTPSVTMRWPGLSPRTISTRPSCFSPVRTATRLAAPSATTEDIAAVALATTASSGTAAAVRACDSIVTVSSMPGFSRRSGLGRIARTVTARVSGLSTGSMLAMVPRNGCSGKAGGLGLDHLAGGDLRQQRLGHREIELDLRDVADLRDLGAGLDHRPRRDVAQRHPARKGRTDHPVGDRGARLAGLRRRLRGKRRLRVDGAVGGEAARLERVEPVELLARLAGAGAGLGKLGILLAEASTATIWPRTMKSPSSKLSRWMRSVTGAASVTCSLACAVRRLRSARRNARTRPPPQSPAGPRAAAHCPPAWPPQPPRTAASAINRIRLRMSVLAAILKAWKRKGSWPGFALRRNKKFDIPLRPGDRAARDAENAPAARFEPVRHVAADARMDLRIAHHAALPTSPRPASNCGLISATSRAPGAAKPSGTSSTLARAMKLASQTIRSTGAGMCAAVRMRALVCSWTATRGSWRSFQASWLVPESTAWTRAAPRSAKRR